MDEPAKTFSDIPARLDRLPWSKFHWRVVIALGITWILDGLEVSIVGALGPTLQRLGTLHLSEPEIGLTASAYLIGSVFGAAIFSYLTDRQGRKKWFLITLAVYLVATLLTACSWNLWSFLFFRFLTGVGIGGEYSAINSAIDELIPARHRGHTDLAINGSWWIGTALGAILSVPLLDTSLIPEFLGWRLCFLLGGILGVSILTVRRLIPESPRWLLMHGRAKEAEIVVKEIEEVVRVDSKISLLSEPTNTIAIHAQHTPTLLSVATELFYRYPQRTALGLILMITQSFLYNAIFFSSALVLSRYYQVPADSVGWYLIPFAIGNFLGPLLLGRLFDTIGRRIMIALTYGTSAILLALTGWLFLHGYLTATTQTVAWSVVFFFASAGASSAYLTVSEVFPLEIRAMAIAFFFIVAQGSASLAPWLFGHVVETSRQSVVYGYLLGAAGMLVGAIAAIFWAVDSERRSLEDIAAPLGTRERAHVERQ